jgi:hypothetical protein
MSEPVSWPNFPASWENTGNFVRLGLQGGETLQIWEQYQSITKQFPTRLNREFFAALQGNKSGDQGTSRPDQGILFWSPLRSRKREGSPSTDNSTCSAGASLWQTTITPVPTKPPRPSPHHIKD